jgi:hypothetical protein
MAEDHVLSIEEVLAEEANAILGPGSSTKVGLDSIITGAGAQKKRFDLNADERTGDETKDLNATKAAREKLYHSLNQLNHAALCFSGGGIRSATFCLGTLEALARCNQIPPPPKEKKEPPHHDKNGQPHHEKSEHSHPHGSEEHHEAKPLPIEKTLLGRFHYLSTVSGGGYIGSWLSAWRKRASFEEILANLTGRPSGPDFEPPQISWLRAYSNYLTPQLGIGSADSWAAVAIVVRNLVLNWFVIIPIVAFAILALKATAAYSVWFAQNVDSCARMLGLAAVGALLLIVAQAFTTYHRPALMATPPDNAPKIKCWLCWHNIGHEKPFFCRRINVNDTCFIAGDLIWAVLSAIVLTIFFTSHYFWMLPDVLSKSGNGSGIVADIGNFLKDSPRVATPALTAIPGLVIYTIGWIVGWPRTFNFGDWVKWALSGLVYGALVGFGAYLFRLLAPYPPAGSHVPLLAGIILGVPWILMSQLIADDIFGGLVSNEPQSDSDREWLGRAAGWLSAFAIAWIIVAFLVFAGEYGVQSLLNAGRQYVVASGGLVAVISGIATALLGSSSKTPAKSSSAKPNDYTALAYDIGLAIAGPVFVALLIVGLSMALDKVLFDESLVKLLKGPPAAEQNNPPLDCGPLKDVAICLRGGTLSVQDGKVSMEGGTLSVQGSMSAPQETSIQSKDEAPSDKSIARRFLVGFLVLGFVVWLASYYVNINRFSLHAIYRNRLIRAYLGASRDERHPDRFTGFDDSDNVRMHELWPKDIEPRKLFHVVNMALNVVSTKRLAWQERKAEPFTVTALHSGGAYVGFRKSEDYGDSYKLKTNSRGITLGTAMAISGAAVSSNMGYNSSPSLSLLLTLFNVRLGWWLGNPGEAGNTGHAYRRQGPKWAARPLFDEALGRTTDQNPYVYLSDGGHFEDLGFYEMVRRRCRLIFVVDAGCDPDFTFEDLGNAVRKIYIDLGIRVTFEGLGDLLNRPTDKKLRALAAAAEKEASQGGDAEKANTSGGGTPPTIPYHAIGTIKYSDVAADGPQCEDGKVIYIKPAYHGTEGAAIRSYANDNPTFPHETTVDQWFTESQFESYRALALDVCDQVFRATDVQDVLRNFLSPAGH